MFNLPGNGTSAYSEGRLTRGAVAARDLWLKMNLALFDFDGTITRHDTWSEFLRGKRRHGFAVARDHDAAALANPA